MVLVTAPSIRSPTWHRKQRAGRSKARSRLRNLSDSVKSRPLHRLLSRDLGVLKIHHSRPSCFRAEAFLGSHMSWKQSRRMDGNIRARPHVLLRAIHRILLWFLELQQQFAEPVQSIPGWAVILHASTTPSLSRMWRFREVLCFCFVPLEHRILEVLDRLTRSSLRVGCATSVLTTEPRMDSMMNGGATSSTQRWLHGSVAAVTCTLPTMTWNTCSQNGRDGQTRQHGYRGINLGSEAHTKVAGHNEIMLLCDDCCPSNGGLWHPRPGCTTGHCGHISSETIQMKWLIGTASCSNGPT